MVRPGDRRGDPRLHAGRLPAAAGDDPDALEFRGGARRLVASDENRWGLPKASEKSFQWSNKGRWGVNVNVEEPVGREPDSKDVEAGAFFSINKQLRVGGTVRLDEKATERRVQRPEEREPRVRLETKFRF